MSKLVKTTKDRAKIHQYQESLIKEFYTDFFFIKAFHRRLLLSQFKNDYISLILVKFNLVCVKSYIILTYYNQIV